MNRLRESKPNRVFGLRSTGGQSFVEFALLVPFLLLFISGLVEFGFALNMYLDLVDTAREVARYTSDDNPFPADPGSPLQQYNPEFYEDAGNLTEYSLNTAGQIELNDETDDVVISIFQLKAGTVLEDRIPPEFADTRLGEGVLNGGESGWSYFGNHATSISTTEVQNRINRMGSEVPPDSGIVLVEVYYEYHMVLGLPWITAFIDDPMLMHAYTFAPIPAAKPD